MKDFIASVAIAAPHIFVIIGVICSLMAIKKDSVVLGLVAIAYGLIAIAHAIFILTKN